MLSEFTEGDAPVVNTYYCGKRAGDLNDPCAFLSFAECMYGIKNC